MSLLNLMAMGTTSAAKASRRVARHNASQPVGAAPGIREGMDTDFGTTLSAVRGRLNPESGTPSSVKKTDKAPPKKDDPSSNTLPDERQPEQPPTDTPTTTPSTPEASSESQADHITSEEAADPAADVPDATSVCSTVTPSPTTIPPGDTPVLPPDAAAPSKTNPEPVGKSLPAKSVHITPEDSSQTPKATPTPDSTSGSNNATNNTPDTQEISAANSDSSTPAPTPPLLADKGGKSHEKTTHAAHVPALESDSPSSPTPAAPVVAEVAATMAQTQTHAASLTPLPLKETPPSAILDTSQSLLSGDFRSVSQDVASADVAHAAQESPPASTTETFEQIVLGLKGKLDARTGKAEIRMDPPDLGTVRVSVTLDNGQLTAEFRSDSSVVRDLLKGNLEKLKTALQGQGVAVDRLAVEAPSDAGKSGQNPQASFGSATHDGRSAGQYQDPRSDKQRSGEGFARLFTKAQEAPLDLVA